MACALIEDGLTLSASIPAKMPLHPAVNFKYRPALPEDVYAYLRGPQTGGADELKAATKLLAKHLVEWDVTDKSGAPAPLTEETFRRLHQPILALMVNFVAGYTAQEQEADLKNSATRSGS